MAIKVVIIAPGANEHQVNVINKRALEWLNNPKSDALVLGGGDPKSNFKVEMYDFDDNTGEVEVINKVGG